MQGAARIHYGSGGMIAGGEDNRPGDHPIVEP